MKEHFHAVSEISLIGRCAIGILATWPSCSGEVDTRKSGFICLYTQLAAAVSAHAVSCWMLFVGQIGPEDRNSEWRWSAENKGGHLFGWNVWIRHMFLMIVEPDRRLNIPCTTISCPPVQSGWRRVSSQGDAHLSWSPVNKIKVPCARHFLSRAARRKIIQLFWPRYILNNTGLLSIFLLM